MIRVLSIGAVVMLQLSCAPASHENAEYNALQRDNLAAFENLQSQVLNPRCVNCHYPYSGRVDLSSQSAILRVPGLVVAGAPEASNLYLRVRKGEMPPTGPLPEDEIEKIRLWILNL